MHFQSSLHQFEILAQKITPIENVTISTEEEFQDSQLNSVICWNKEVKEIWNCCLFETHNNMQIVKQK